MVTMVTVVTLVTITINGVFQIKKSVHTACTENIVHTIKSCHESLKMMIIEAMYQTIFTPKIIELILLVDGR